MNIFNTILQKLGIQKPAAPAAPASVAPVASPAAPAFVAPASVPPAAAPAAPVPAPAAPPSYTPAAAVPVTPQTFTPAAVGFSTPSNPAPVAPISVPLVDVVSKLELLSKSHPDLDWKVSIVDLLKLLGINESLHDLAIELGCPEFEMADSARRNIWLHKTVLQKIAENGGNIPASLLK